MPDAKKIEDIIQQKMDGFRMEPVEADWDAIHARLHPRKKKRFIWWWLPLGLIIATGAFWLLQQNGTFLSSPQETSALTPEEQVKTVPDDINGKNQAGSLDQNNRHLSGPSAGSAGTNTLTQKTADRSIPNLASNKQTTRKPAVANRHRSLLPATKKQNVYREPTPTAARPVKGERPDKIVGSSGDPEIEGSSNPDKLVEQDSQSQTTAISDTQQILKKSGTNIGATQGTRPEADNDAKSPAQPQKDDAETLPETSAQDSATTVDTNGSEKSASIPVLKNMPREGWQFGVSAGAGFLHPLRPLSGAKAASSADNLGSAPSGAALRLEENSRNGIQLNIGLLVEKRSRNFSFSSGLGLQHNHWSKRVNTFEETVQQGQVKTELVATHIVNYRMFGLELPLQLQFRIAGKPGSSLWISPGLNNFFALSMRQKLASGTGGYGLFTGRNDSSLSSGLHRYQPQLRLGLMYERVGKTRWQLLPMVQYGINSVSRTGDPDISMLHLQLQYRHFFRN